MKVNATRFHITEVNFPAGNYMLKANNRNPRTRCKICSELTIETLEQDMTYA